MSDTVKFTKQQLEAINHDDARRQRAAARLYIPSGYMAQSVFINNGSIWRELFE